MEFYHTAEGNYSRQRHTFWMDVNVFLISVFVQMTPPVKHTTCIIKSDQFLGLTVTWQGFCELDDESILWNFMLENNNSSSRNSFATMGEAWSTLVALILKP